MRCLCTLFLEETALLGVRKIPFLEAAPFQRAGPAVLGRCPAFVCVRGVPISDAALRLVSCAGVERAGNEVMPRSRGGGTTVYRSRPEGGLVRCALWTRRWSRKDRPNLLAQSLFVFTAPQEPERGHPGTGELAPVEAVRCKLHGF